MKSHIYSAKAKAITEIQGWRTYLILIVIQKAVFLSKIFWDNSERTYDSFKNKNYHK